MSKRPTLELGPWAPDRTAPILHDGQEVGRLVQCFSWYDLRFPSGEVWAGGKAISKALATFAYVADLHPEYLQGESHV
jgi:hypothetical protein